jgi:hypothetical protein
MFLARTGSELPHASQKGVLGPTQAGEHGSQRSAAVAQCRYRRNRTHVSLQAMEVTGPPDRDRKGRACLRRVRKLSRRKLFVFLSGCETGGNLSPIVLIGRYIQLGVEVPLAAVNEESSSGEQNIEIKTPSPSPLSGLVMLLMNWWSRGRLGVHDVAGRRRVLPSCLSQPSQDPTPACTDGCLRC